MVNATNQLTTLSDNQLLQAWSIAQYDVKAAYRYCLMIDSTNRMKCPSCKEDLSGRYDRLDVSMALVCEKCTSRKKRRIAANNCLEMKLNPMDYYDICEGKSIKIDIDTAKHQAKKFKVINEKTNSYVVRTLVVLGSGNMGYWI
ncbi:MAG: hypothetical protein HWQ36_26310 [Nostoc sp. NMS2]|uniref:hypothetical protein n=1 Tax=Nostoc sp. NMS2 TaxID=2815389 RepID=UPI0025D8826D|nr:hypothetical protein [Nostoc sp. NMS2]MBN3993902.1 hypothetical protein [Nostoc sp. NMS2]